MFRKKDEALTVLLFSGRIIHGRGILNSALSEGCRDAGMDAVLAFNLVNIEELKRRGIDVSAVYEAGSDRGLTPPL